MFQFSFMVSTIGLCRHGPSPFGGPALPSAGCRIVQVSTSRKLKKCNCRSRPVDANLLVLRFVSLCIDFFCCSSSSVENWRGLHMLHVRWKDYAMHTASESRSCPINRPRTRNGRLCCAACKQAWWQPSHQREYARERRWGSLTCFCCEPLRVPLGLTNTFSQ